MSKKLFSLILVFAMSIMAFGAVQAQEDELLFPVGEGPFTWSDLEAFEGVDLGGEEVIVFGPWETGDEESFNNVVAYFNSVVTNGSVTYVGSGSFEQQIVIDIEGNDPPNIAAFPQPGLAADLAARGGLVPLGDDYRDFVLENYAAGQSWVDLTTYEDADGEDDFFGIFYNVNLKSLVWYVPDNFAEAGYEVPTTWDELIALSDQIVEDGGTPWCLGIANQAATGWPATDWVEDLLLRTAPVEVYQQWYTNEIPFTDPQVQQAIELFGQIARNPDYVVGGPSGVQTTDFRDSPAGLFSVPAECYLHRMPSFITAFFPEGVVVGEDADFFYFPPVDEEIGNPVLGGGTLLAITKDSPATRLFFDFINTPLAHELWAAQPGFLTPHTGINLDAYSSDALRRQGEILLNADTFGFDASDLMPGAIGAGAFWTGMVDYVGGASVEDVTAEIQAVWDSLD